MITDKSPPAGQNPTTTFDRPVGSFLLYDTDNVPHQFCVFANRENLAGKFRIFELLDESRTRITGIHDRQIILQPQLGKTIMAHAERLVKRWLEQGQPNIPMPISPEKELSPVKTFREPLSGQKRSVPVNDNPKTHFSKRQKGGDGGGESADNEDALSTQFERNGFFTPPSTRPLNRTLFPQ